MVYLHKKGGKPPFFVLFLCNFENYPCGVVYRLQKFGKIKKNEKTVGNCPKKEESPLKNVLLIMTRASLAQGLLHKGAEVSDLQFFFEADYEKSIASVKARSAETVLLEISESGMQDTAYCLALSESIKREVPGCRILLMCPESDPDSVKKTIGAKRSGRIDDFVFYDASMDYLITVLRAL